MNRISPRMMTLSGTYFSRARAAILLVVTGLLGCAPQDIDVKYGKRRGTPGSASVNGTSVLAAIFESSGHRVTTWRRLSPRLEEADTLVWFPDSFALPTIEQRKFIENWLENQPGRTFVFVGRDYDAAIDYWTKVQPMVPAEQAIEVSRRMATVQANHDQRRTAMPRCEPCDWFTVDDSHPRRSLTTLAGPWREGLDGSKSEITLEARFNVPTQKEIDAWLARDWRFSEAKPSFERLLYSGDDPIVSRLSWSDWSDSQILVVTNGSFLLNLPLVNHQHRRLAGKLVNACGPPGKVVFLESDDTSLAIFAKEPGQNAPTGFEVFTVWPLGVILVHLTALGILACIALFPVFGRPRELPTQSTGDFGQHIAAFGELLEMTGDRVYATERLRQFHEQTKKEAS